MAMISLLRGTCWRCEYQAVVGIGREAASTSSVEWAPANCANCGLVSVNVVTLDSKRPACHDFSPASCTRSTLRATHSARAFSTSKARRATELTRRHLRLSVSLLAVVIELQDDAEDVVRQVDHPIWRGHVPHIRTTTHTSVEVHVIRWLGPQRREVQNYL